MPSKVSKQVSLPLGDFGWDSPVRLLPSLLRAPMGGEEHSPQGKPGLPEGPARWSSCPLSFRWLLRWALPSARQPPNGAGTESEPGRPAPRKAGWLAFVSRKTGAQTLPSTFPRTTSQLPGQLFGAGPSSPGSPWEGDRNRYFLSLFWALCKDFVFEPNG